MKDKIIIGVLLLVCFLVLGFVPKRQMVDVTTVMTEETGKAQLRQLENMNENLQDIKGLLNSIAENTRK